MIRNQLSLQDARRLLDYRDGSLFWRQAGSGRRADLRAVTRCGKRAEINVGGTRYQAHYVVWNWHHGVTRNQIVPADGDKLNIAIENLREIETVRRAGRFISAPSPHQKCPCCSQVVPVQSAGIVAINCGLSPIEAKILYAIWSGSGRPVQTERIFDEMYSDDPNGGPRYSRMYASLKEGMVGLRKKLAGSGVGIETVGYRDGWRLVLGVK